MSRAPHPDAAEPAPAVARARDVLAVGPPPISLTTALGVVAGSAIGALVGAAVSPVTAAISGILAAAFAAIGSQGSLFIAWRNVGVAWASVCVAALLARITFDSPWAAALAMAAVAFAATVVQSAPMIGLQTGAISGLAFLLLAINDLGPGMPAETLPAAGLISLVAAALVVTVVHLPDARRDSRRIVASTFAATTPLSVHGLARAALRTDFHPAVLTSMLQSAGLVFLGRSVAFPAAVDDPRVGRALGQADQASLAVAAALEPRGRTVPRDVADVDLSLLRSAVDAADIDGAARVGLEQVRYSLDTARALVEGRRTPPPQGEWPSSLKWALRARLTPDSGLFRFGIQRAIALGVGMLVFKLIAPEYREDGYWVLLALFLALQPGRLATPGAAAARGLGALVGILVSVGLWYPLSGSVLIPILGVAFIVAGLVFAWRNETVAALFITAFAVLLVGISTYAVPEWGLRRLAAVAAGLLLALVITSVVLPARAFPRSRAAKARTAIANMADAVAAVADRPQHPARNTPICAYEALAMAAELEMANERCLIRQPELLARHDEVVEALTRAREDCDGLVLAAMSGPNHELMQAGLDRARGRLDEVDALVVTLPSRA